MMYLKEIMDETNPKNVYAKLLDVNLTAVQPQAWIDEQRSVKKKAFKFVVIFISLFVILTLISAIYFQTREHKKEILQTRSIQGGRYKQLLSPDATEENKDEDSSKCETMMKSDLTFQEKTPQPETHILKPKKSQSPVQKLDKWNTKIFKLMS